MPYIFIWVLEKLHGGHKRTTARRPRAPRAPDTRATREYFSPGAGGDLKTLCGAERWKEVLLESFRGRELGLRRPGHVEAAAAWRSAGVRSTSILCCWVAEVKMEESCSAWSAWGSLSLSLSFSLNVSLSRSSWKAEVQACEKPVIGWCKSVEIGGGETGGGGVSVWWRSTVQTVCDYIMTEDLVTASQEDWLFSSTGVTHIKDGLSPTFHLTGWALLWARPTRPSGLQSEEV